MGWWWFVSPRTTAAAIKTPRVVLTLGGDGEQNHHSVILALLWLHVFDTAGNGVEHLAQYRAFEHVTKNLGHAAAA